MRQTTRARLSLSLLESRVVVFEPVTHSAQFLDVKGEPTRERRNISIVYGNERMLMGTVKVNPGSLLLSLENRSNNRVLPAVWVTGAGVHHLLSKRKPILTAKRLLSDQTFRDLYRTETLDVRQRLKITSMTFMFTDLKGSQPSTNVLETWPHMISFMRTSMCWLRLSRLRAAQSSRRLAMQSWQPSQRPVAPSPLRSPRVWR